MSFSRNAASYLPRPRLRSQTTMSMMSSRSAWEHIMAVEARRGPRDSVGVRRVACKLVRQTSKTAERFRKIILEQFVRMYRDNDVLAQVLDQAHNDLGEVVKDLPNPPEQGDLKIEEVLGADFASPEDT